MDPQVLRARRGFTLVEVMVALVILSVVLVGMASMTGSLLRNTTTSDRVAAAIQLAEHRIEQVQLEPSYARLDSLYAGVESNFPEFPGFTRTTTVVRYGGSGQPYDYRKVTVTVSGPGLPAPVSRTVTVAAP
jgi:prepilin-type N-terminal cleavage/methylation domain-containing protein